MSTATLERTVLSSFLDTNALDADELRTHESLWEAFTQGDCWVLAKYLHDITGWPIAIIAYKEELNFKHLGVLTPDNRFLDFGGVHDNTDDVISDYVNGYTDEALFYTVDIAGWERLRDNMISEQLKAGGSDNPFRYVEDHVIFDDVVYDDNEDMVSVVDIAHAIIYDYLVSN